MTDTKWLLYIVDTESTGSSCCWLPSCDMYRFLRFDDEWHSQFVIRILLKARFSFFFFFFFFLLFGRLFTINSHWSIISKFFWRGTVTWIIRVYSMFDSNMFRVCLNLMLRSKGYRLFNLRIWSVVSSNSYSNSYVNSYIISVSELGYFFFNRGYLKVAMYCFVGNAYQGASIKDLGSSFLIGIAHMYL